MIDEEFTVEDEQRHFEARLAEVKRRLEQSYDARKRRLSGAVTRENGRRLVLHQRDGTIKIFTFTVPPDCISGFVSPIARGKRDV